MAEFCKECSLELFGEDFGELTTQEKGLKNLKEERYEIN